MAVIKVPTNFNIEVDFEVPEFYRRLLSLAIDTLFLFFYYKIAIEILIAILKIATYLTVIDYTIFTASCYYLFYLSSCIMQFQKF